MLSNLKVKSITEKGRYLDSDGLYLLVNKAGRKSWVYRFQLNNRRRDMGLGKYPLVSLSDARKQRDLAMNLVRQGVDPITARKAEQYALNERKSFAELAAEYIDSKRDEWTNSKHAKQWTTTLETYAYPYIGDLPVSDINTAMIRDMLAPIAQTIPETAQRVRSRVENVIDYAIALGHTERANPAANKVVSKVLTIPPKSKRVKHFAAMPYSELPEFCHKLKGHFVTSDRSAKALLLLILTATRTNEVIAAHESEFNGSLWVIPANRMKSHREHRVPLSTQAVELIESIHSDGYLFPSSHSKVPYISTNTMHRFLRSTLGEKIYTVHGFRSSFRDWVAEQTDYDSRLAEASLAHVLQDKTEAAYQRGDMLQKRRVLMQDWADYLTGEE